MGQPSRCVGWSRHDLLAHLDATEEYFHAGLAGTVGELFARYAAAGVTDLHAANAQGVAARADIADGELLTQWSTAAAETRAGMRARDGGEVDTSVGAYPTRWQAFHIAGELAIHADDLGVPVAEDEAAARLAWRTRFSCFALAETKPGSEATIVDDHLVRVHTVDGADHELDAATFVAAVAAAGRYVDRRRPAGGAVDHAVTMGWRDRWRQVAGAVRWTVAAGRRARRTGRRACTCAGCRTPTAGARRGWDRRGRRHVGGHRTAGGAGAALLGVAGVVRRRRRSRARRRPPRLAVVPGAPGLDGRQLGWLPRRWR
ncbi:MAG: maleylpyruvate isomerase N-terminal domain-containing protein [Acidimicrobiales bacterium]